jgi:hypothetical protein
MLQLFIEAPLRRLVYRVPVLKRWVDEILLFIAAGGSPRTYSLFRTVRPYTMINRFKLRNIWRLACAVEESGLRGAFVECGVWRGGAAALMAYAAKTRGSARPTWLFDSFEGLPEPTSRDGQAAREYAHDRAGGELASIGECVASEHDAEQIMSKLGIDPRSVKIVKGWFQDTLPIAVKAVGPIALLRLDGDWYESTRLCLDVLFESVESGGYVVLDDYDFWQGSRTAVDEFLAERGLRPELQRIFRGGRYFSKQP